MRWGFTPRTAAAPYIATAMATAVALVGVLALVGCGADPGPVTSPSARAAISATPTPTPTHTPTPTVFLGTGVAIGYSCDALVDPKTIDLLDTDLTENAAYRPTASTTAARAVAIRGTACQWVDATTGASLIVTVAHPDPPTLQDITSTTQGYAKTTTLFGSDVSGYLVNTQAEIFTRSGYWATATSPFFADTTKLRAVMAAVEDALPIG